MPLDESVPGDGSVEAPAASGKAKLRGKMKGAREAPSVRAELFGAAAPERPSTTGKRDFRSPLYCLPVKPRAAFLARKLRALIAGLRKGKAESINIQPVHFPKATPKAQEFLAERVEHVEKTTTILLTVHSLGLLLLTYRGVSVPMLENGGGLLQKGEALALATTIAVLSWLGWKYIFSLLPRLHGRRLLSAVGGAVLYLSALVAMDAQFVMVGIGGAAATKLSFEAVASAYEQRRNAASARLAFLRQLLPAFRAQEQRFLKAEQDELKGRGTGLPGTGKVSAAYGSTASQLTTLIGEIERALAEAASVEREVGDIVGRINTLVHEQSPISERAEAVSTAAARLDEKLAELAQLDLSPAMLATLKVLESSIPEPGPARNKIEEAQNVQIEMIRKVLTPVAEALRAAIRDLAATPSSQPPRLRPIDPMAATKVYWRELLPLWIASGFVDVAPALLLLIGVAAQRQADAERTNRRRL
ncbi:hypothetical protein [Reyranella sp.]|jgi:hypothetical protein|uniref:hypothetical protein n=1 Tax=Reyranella sp. TaxID=1929291 RepID=UPI002C35D476|nr:hypothetical protein [Reyranella sp.]HQS14889.1 hypothetical protein [Reyranella sp.]HQT14276.1 hypothetical protein [Reyranella sp.]